MPDTDPAADEQAVLHLRELAYFLGVHLNRAPGMMWSEHDHPALDTAAGPHELEAFARALGLLTDLPVRSRPGRRRAGGPASGTTVAHLLVHQTVGAGSWSLKRTPRASAHEDGGRHTGSLPFRLRKGDVLYVPAYWGWEADLTPEAELVVSVLGSSSDEPGETP
ncbi:hypothetical protein ACFYVL_44085 [Streptomyces sp. NPDC004111]|uniref:hypothetical protein n=1 Tax=Streptomyces sp. NPDC004111 TaxID=3364690 RepID=UPI003677B769